MWLVCSLEDRELALLRPRTIRQEKCAEDLAGSSLDELKGFDQRGAIAIPELDVIG